MAKPVHIAIGDVYNRWTIVREAEQRGKFRYFLCRCSCGTERIVILANLRNGKSGSCGCLHRDIQLECHRTHGMVYSPEYQSWCAAKSRCTNPKNKCFNDYGGRGITMCDRWINSFECFYADVGMRPSHKHSLDRYPDKNGNYEPGNVRWATAREQAANTRRNAFLEFRGESLCVSEWERRIGLRPGTVKDRLRLGWSVEEALATPARKCKRK